MLALLLPSLSLDFCPCIVVRCMPTNTSYCCPVCLFTHFSPSHICHHLPSHTHSLSISSTLNLCTLLCQKLAQPLQRLFRLLRRQMLHRLEQVRCHMLIEIDSRRAAVRNRLRRRLSRGMRRVARRRGRSRRGSSWEYGRAGRCCCCCRLRGSWRLCLHRWLLLL